MNSEETKKVILKIEAMKNNGVFDNYIEYITFPFYKNLVQGSKITFDFPMTVLVGKNGSGKSSTLHALFGAPKGYSLGDFWFSTDVDPIAESGEANRFFYGYRESNKNPEIKEVMKTRSKRSETEKKKQDLDYWETCRPRKSDGMSIKLDKDNKVVREAPVEKKVIYIDFRAEISAFDKVLHFSKEDLEVRKTLLRERSKYVSRLFAGERMRFPGMPDDRVGRAEDLSAHTVKIISNILGKSYVGIKIAEHRVYKNPGVSAFIKSERQGHYSEANAGSGEFAVIQLVRQIEKAPNYALILLDEPEVSIHPGAQKRLKEYLLDVIIKKKLQVVISTHSPAIIENMPQSAIKLYRTTESGKFEISQDVTYHEAFFDIEDRPDDKKIIYCEDYAAQVILQKLLKEMGKEKLFEIVYYPGGEKTLVGKYMPPFAMNMSLRNKVFLFLDGDMKTNYQYVGEDNLTKHQSRDPEFLKQEVEKAYGTPIDAYPDGGKGGKRDDQVCDIYLKYLSYYASNVFFLSDEYIPERILLSSAYAKKKYADILRSFEPIDNMNAKQAVFSISQSEYGDDDNMNGMITQLAYKWSLEESKIREDMKSDLNTILES